MDKEEQEAFDGAVRMVEAFRVRYPQLEVMWNNFAAKLQPPALETRVAELFPGQVGRYRVLVVSKGSNNAAQAAISSNVLEFDDREGADFAYNYLDGTTLSNGCVVAAMKLYPFDAKEK